MAIVLTQHSRADWSADGGELQVLVGFSWLEPAETKKSLVVVMGSIIECVLIWLKFTVGVGVIKPGISFVITCNLCGAMRRTKLSCLQLCKQKKYLCGIEGLICLQEKKVLGTTVLVWDDINLEWFRLADWIWTSCQKHLTFVWNCCLNYSNGAKFRLKLAELDSCLFQQSNCGTCATLP